MAETPQRWLTLTTCHGQDVDNPSPVDLSQAINELREVPEKAQEGAEKANIRLRSEVEPGPIYVLEVDRDGTACLSEFNDEESDDPVVELTVQISFEKALEILTWLTNGEAEKVKEEMSKGTS